MDMTINKTNTTKLKQQKNGASTAFSGNWMEIVEPQFSETPILTLKGHLSIGLSVRLHKWAIRMLFVSIGHKGSPLEPAASRSNTK